VPNPQICQTHIKIELVKEGQKKPNLIWLFFQKCKKAKEVENRQKIQIWGQNPNWQHQTKRLLP